MGYCSLRVVTRPVVEPVSMNEAALHLRIDADASELPGYVATARSWAESYLNRALITQTLRFTVSPSLPGGSSYGAVINPIIFVAPLTWWPLAGRPINLPMSPVQSISTVTQQSRNGTVTTLVAGTDFNADVANDPGRVTLYGIGQPLGSDLAITYVAGYGDTADFVPPTIKHAIKLLTAFFYEHRGDDEGEPPSAVKMLLAPERLVTFA